MRGIWRMNLLPGGKNAFGFCYQEGIIGIDSKTYKESLQIRESVGGFFHMKDEDLVLVRNSSSQDYHGQTRLYLGEIKGERKESASQRDPGKYTKFKITNFFECPLHEVRSSDMDEAVEAYYESRLVREWRDKYPRGAVERVRDPDERGLTETIWQQMLHKI